MKKHMNQLRKTCDNTEFFDESQSQSFSDLVLSSTEHTGRFSALNKDLSENEKAQKFAKTKENER